MLKYETQESQGALARSHEFPEMPPTICRFVCQSISCLFAQFQLSLRDRNCNFATSEFVLHNICQFVFFLPTLRSPSISNCRIPTLKKRLWLITTPDRTSVGFSFAQRPSRTPACAQLCMLHRISIDFAHTAPSAAVSTPIFIRPFRFAPLPTSLMP